MLLSALLSSVEGAGGGGGANGRGGRRKGEGRTLEELIPRGVHRGAGLASVLAG